MTSRPVAELDLPSIDDPNLSDTERQALIASLATEHWMVRNAIGYSVLQYPDVVAVLRDKRWHSATSKIPEMMGITDPDFLGNRRVSILSAEGDVHTRSATAIFGPTHLPVTPNTSEAMSQPRRSGVFAHRCVDRQSSIEGGRR